MTLPAGTLLGTYEIVAPIGAGGMGEVYRARDTKLDREVAVKVLPAVFAGDPDRLMRFEREAKALAALNHPNIAHIHGAQEAGETRALVMELVEGPTLAERLARGRVPLDEVLSIARQIAGALEAAHEQGIVNRDLKPANVKVREDGTVKLLDFGLAKAMDSAARAAQGSGAGADPGLENSPTMTSPALTALGVVLGTAAYMAPEQARGRAVDKRADIWAFGVVLYEMLLGTPLFAGETVQDTLASVLRADVDLGLLPAGVPEGVRRLLARCLEKDPARRLRDIGEARILLDSPTAGTGRSGVVPPEAKAREPRRPWAWVAALAATAVVSAGATGLVLRAPAPAILRASISLPPGTEYAIGPSNVPSLAVSPDGSTLAFAAMPLGGNPEESTVYIRRLADAEATAVPDSTGGRAPFFSPDGRWVAFAAGSALRKVSANGGAPVTLTEGVSNIWGGTWLANGTIVYANPQPNGDMLFSVSEEGGVPVRVSRVERLDLDNSFPRALADGDLLVTMWTGGFYTDAKIARFSRKAGTTTETLVEGGGQGQPLEAGYLVYARGAELFATPFRGRKPSGAVKVLDGVLTDQSYATAQFDVSPSGTLAYAPASNTKMTAALVWVTGDGRLETVFEDPRIEPPRLSADGRHVVYVSTQDGREKDLWTYDLVARRRSRLTSTRGEEYSPAISADGSVVLFSAWRQAWGLHRLSVTGGAEREVPVPRDRAVRAWSFSPDGRWLAVTDDVPGGAHDRSRSDIGVLDLESAALDRRWLAETPFREDQPVFSPDGKRIAYVSNQLGQNDVWVTSFPVVEGQPPVPVSREGGVNPFWSSDGRTLYYEAGARLLSATVEAGDPPRAGEPRDVMAIPSLRMVGAAPDGRFLAVRRERAPVTRIDLVVNWVEEFKTRVR